MVENPGSEFLSKAVVTEDPLIDMEIGSQLKFETLEFGPLNGGATPQAISNRGFFKGSVLAIGIANPKGTRIIGSAVIIGPALACSAKHVLEEWIPNLEEGTEALFLLGPRGPDMDHWQVSSVAFSKVNDVCYLSLTLRSALPENQTLSKFLLRIKPPLVGEMLNVVGWRFEDLVPALDGANDGLTFLGDLYGARGRVTQVLPGGRDRLMLPGPCVEITCGALGGMSGGPVFDDRGRLVAILSTSLGDERNEGPAYASWLPPTFDQYVALNWPPGLFPDSVRLIEMDPRMLAIEDRERITMTYEGDITHIAIKP